MKSILSSLLAVAVFILPLSLEAKRLVREFSHLVDDAFRSNPQMVGAFERILVAPATPFSVLNEMLHCGFLPQFIPEFGRIKAEAARFTHDGRLYSC